MNLPLLPGVLTMAYASYRYWETVFDQLRSQCKGMGSLPFPLSFYLFNLKVVLSCYLAQPPSGFTGWGNIAESEDYTLSSSIPIYLVNEADPASPQRISNLAQR